MGLLQVVMDRGSGDSPKTHPNVIQDELAVNGMGQRSAHSRLPHDGVLVVEFHERHGGVKEIPIGSQFQMFQCPKPASIRRGNGAVEDHVDVARLNSRTPGLCVRDHFEDDSIKVRLVGFEIIGVPHQHDGVATPPFTEHKGAGAHWLQVGWIAPDIGVVKQVSRQDGGGGHRQRTHQRSR